MCEKYFFIAIGKFKSILSIFFTAFFFLKWVWRKEMEIGGEFFLRARWELWSSDFFNLISDLSISKIR